MAQLSKPAIPPKMYKHFAVTTCALTALLALFASGGPDESSTRPTPQSTQSGRPPSSEATPAYGQAQLNTGAVIEEGNGYYNYQEYEARYQRVSSGRGAIGEIGATTMSRAGSENAGFTREYLDSLTDEELDELLRQLRAGGVDDPATRAQIMQLLETGSRRRSGGN